jgi:hypothetical protein
MTNQMQKKTVMPSSLAAKAMNKRGQTTLPNVWDKKGTNSAQPGAQMTTAPTKTLTMLITENTPSAKDKTDTKMGVQPESCPPPSPFK